MKKTLIIYLYFIVFVVQGQNSLTLTNGIHKRHINKGRTIGITLHGESNKYYGWESIYKTPDFIRQNLWTVDKIGSDSLYLVNLNYTVVFHNDTVARNELYKLKKQDYIVDTIIKSLTKKRNYDKLVCRVTETKLVEKKYKVVKYDDIKSMTFANLDIDTIASRSTKIPPEKGNIGNSIRVDGQDAPVITLIMLVFEIGALIAIDAGNDALAKVHTYEVKDWTINIKKRKKA